MANRLLVILATVALVPLGFLAWGAFVLADTYWSENSTLEELAQDLVPGGSQLVLASSDECNRSGWDGLFTFRDTCYSLRIDTGADEVSSRRDIIRVLAERNGWEIVEDSSPGQLDLRRPGYVAYVRLRSVDEIRSCADSAPEPAFCYDSLLVIDER